MKWKKNTFLLFSEFVELFSWTKNGVNVLKMFHFAQSQQLHVMGPMDSALLRLYRVYSSHLIRCIFSFSLTHTNTYTFKSVGCTWKLHFSKIEFTFSLWNSVIYDDIELSGVLCVNNSTLKKTILAKMKLAQTIWKAFWFTDFKNTTHITNT